jgi:Ca-activated chloride channel family protein
MPRPQTIRDRLEHDAWRRYPDFARRHVRPQDPPRRTLLSWQDRALLIVAMLLVLLLIVRVETVRAAEEDNFWGLELASDGSSLRSLALDTEIRAEITGLAARVEVTQWFYNGGSEWREAVYRFPLPPGAAVDRLRIEAGERVLEGEIRERTEARRQYQQARAAGSLASLVEQQRPNQFETRLANIGPNEDIRVTIGFVATVDYADGRFSLRLPLTFTPRWDPPVARPDGVAATQAAVARKARSYTEHAGGFEPGATDPASQPTLAASSGFDDHYLSVDILLHSGMDLAWLESRYHDIDVHPALGGYRVFLADPDTLSDRVFELEWAHALAPEPTPALLTWDGGDAVYALLMLAPPLAEAVEPQPREVVFVIDTSGSMEGQSLHQAKAALRRGLAYLGPDDRFNLVRFDSDAEKLFGESVPTRPAELAEAGEFIAELKADGGTDMAPALALAMGLPRQDGLLRQIVFVTDGSIGNEAELLARIGEQLGDSRLFTVSIGPAPNDWFMRKAAVIGRGSHSRIGHAAEVEERMSALWARIQTPALQNVCIDWGMNAEFYPEIIPDLYAGEPLWLYARLPFEPREVIVCGELDGAWWETAGSSAPRPGGPELGALWARSRIEALEDSRLFGADQQAVRDAVLELALQFGLLTRYTGLVAVEHAPVRPPDTDFAAEDVPGLLPAGSAGTAGFSQTATGWPLRVVLSLFSLLVAGAMLLYATPSRQSAGAGARRPEALRSH